MTLFSRFFYLALNLINIHEPLPKTEHIVTSQPACPHLPFSPASFKNKMTPMVKQSALLLPNITPWQTWLQSLQNQLNATVTAQSVLLSSERRGVGGRAARDSSLCMATCCTGFTELLIPNKNAHAAGVWAEAICTGHANNLAKGLRKA